MGPRVVTGLDRRTWGRQASNLRFPMVSALFPLLKTDTEWRSEVVNSRNFDREIGHKNPR